MRLGQVSGAADHPLQHRRRDVLRGGAIGSKSASHATACCRLGRAVLSRNSSRASRLPSCTRHSSSRAGLGFWSILSPQYARDTFVYFPAHAVPHLRHHRLLRPRCYYRAAYAHLASVVNLPGANGHAPVQGAAFPRLTLSATLQPGNSDTVAPHGGKLLDDRHRGPASTTPEEPPRGSARRLGLRVTHGELTQGADVAGELIRQSRGLGESVQQRADPGGKGATPDRE